MAVAVLLSVILEHDLERLLQRRLHRKDAALGSGY